ncbi:SDR family oxidoreductase [Streptomyces sp. NBC_01236]|uniref:SDR family oxidoreductase n=1 Tax=Streptomyces sp. NBC_01236 TaxID=2903789 RepID=UPI002E0E8125|nr:SDR family oxidoreductase [Streptomyces sp. NBC_01236]
MPESVSAPVSAVPAPVSPVPASVPAPDTTPERIVIVGGSSGMGLALAESALAGGADVTIVGRSPERLAAAERQLGGGDRLRAVAADITSEPDTERLFKTVGETVGAIDHVVLTAADATGAYQPITSFDLEAGRRLVDSKLFGAVLLAKYAAPHLTSGGSITLTSGIAAYRPAPGGSMVAAVNGALASLTYALALELAPIRVNALSPGWVDTPIWDTIAGDGKQARLDAMAQRLPVGRIGTPHDIAEALLALMHNRFITATVLHADGGHRLV